jgi:hypothetical protein
VNVLSRKVFYSFHFIPDNWRAAQVRNIGVIEGNTPVSDNDWEEVKKKGEKAIQEWIDGQLKGRSCTVVLIGENTAGRKWIEYEIKKSWDNGKGLVGIYIHNLKNSEGQQSEKGKNPFENFTLTVDGKKKKLSEIVRAYDPPYTRSTNVYNNIEENLENLVEEAITIRNKY